MMDIYLRKVKMILVTWLKALVISVLYHDANLPFAYHAMRILIISWYIIYWRKNFINLDGRHYGWHTAAHEHIHAGWKKQKRTSFLQITTIMGVKFGRAGWFPSSCLEHSFAAKLYHTVSSFFFFRYSAMWNRVNWPFFAALSLPG